MVDDVDRWLRTLPRLLEIEANAATPAQRAAISRASGTLFAAAQSKGWTGAELARASGYDAGQVNYRAAQARKRSTGQGPGLDLPIPSRTRPVIASK